MGNRRFRVSLVRPVFQYVDVEVEAVEENEALTTAIDGAETIPDDAWYGNFGLEEYGIDAVALDDATDSDDEFFTYIADSKKYLLSKANTDTGEGEVRYPTVSNRRRCTTAKRAIIRSESYSRLIPTRS